MAAGSNGRKLHVLVADDEPAMRLLYRVNLEAEGMIVSEAADGDAAVALAQSERPAVLVLDVMMPRRDGWNVAEELASHAATRAIPIVFVSARAAAADQLRGLELGGIEYVTKPFNPVELAVVIRRAAAAARSQDDPTRGEKLRELRALVDPGPTSQPTR